MGESRRALVVDDEEINRMIALLFLRKEGWIVDQAASGQEALAMLAVRDYHCILLDISMPDMSGLELCRLIHANECWRSSRLIAYTAHFLPDEQAAILQAGFDAIATKPISRENLLEAVQGSREESTAAMCNSDGG